MAGTVHAKDIKKFPFIGRIAGEKPPNAPGDNVADVKRQFVAAAESARGVTISTDTRLPWQKSNRGLLYGTKTERLAFEINLLCDWLGVGRIAEADFLKKRIDRKPDPAVELATYETYRVGITESKMKEGAATRLMKLLTKYALAKEEQAFRQNLENWITGNDTIENYHLCWWLDEESRTNAETGYDPRQYKTGEELIKEIEKLSLAKRKPGLLSVVDETDRTERRTKYFMETLGSKLPDTFAEAYLWYKYMVMQRPVTVDHLGTIHYFEDGKKPWEKESIKGATERFDRDIREMDEISRELREIDEIGETVQIPVSATPVLRRGQVGVADSNSNGGAPGTAIRMKTPASMVTPAPTKKAPGASRKALKKITFADADDMEMASVQSAKIAQRRTPRLADVSRLLKTPTPTNAEKRQMRARITAQKAIQAQRTPTLADLVVSEEARQAKFKQQINKQFTSQATR